MYKKIALFLVIILYSGLSFCQDSWNIELIEPKFTGSCDIIKGFDNFGFTNFGTRFSISDYSDLSNPVEIGYCYLSDFPNNIIILDTLAYLSLQGGKLEIINISDLENPYIISTYNCSHRIKNLDVNGNIAIIVGDGTMSILDITDLHSIEILRNFVFPGVIDVILLDDVYFVLSNFHLYMYRVDDDFSLDVIEVIGTGGVDWNTDIAQKGDHVLVANGSYLAIYYFTFESIEFVDSLRFPSYVISLFDQTAFIQTTYFHEHSTPRSIIKKIDFSDAYDLTVTDSFVVSYYCSDLYASNDYLLATSSEDGLCAFDLTDSSSVYPINEFLPQKMIVQFRVVDNYIYICDSNAVKIYDISDIDSMIYINSIDGFSSLKECRIVDSTLFLFCYEYGARVKYFNIADPANPVEISGTCNIDGKSFDIQKEVDSLEIYSAIGTGHYPQFDFYKFSTYISYRHRIRPSYDYLLTPIEYAPIDGVIFNDYVYLIAYCNPYIDISYLITVDISDTSNIEEINSCEFCSGRPVQIERIDNYLFLSGEDSSLSIFDISDPEYPTEISSIRLDFMVMDVEVKDSFALLACDCGLVVLDISTIDSVFITGYYEIPYISSRVATYNDYVFLSSIEYGYCILDISNAIESVSEALIATTPETMSLSAYPNPFNSAVSIELPDEASNIVIYDINGKLCHKANANSPTYSWQPSQELESGIYNVKVKSNNIEQTSKVVYIK